jgi:hypothetical protein
MTILSNKDLLAQELMRESRECSDFERNQEEEKREIEDINNSP